MGLFDKFRKKVRDAASEIDTEAISAEEGSDEALDAISQQNEYLASRTHVPAYKTQPDFEEESEKKIGKKSMKMKHLNFHKVLMMTGMIGTKKKNMSFRPNSHAEKRKY